VFSIFQKKIPLPRFFELASKLVLDQSADFFRYLKSQRDESQPLTPNQEGNAFYEVTIWEFFVFDQALMKFPDLDYLSVSDRLRAHAWTLFFDRDRAGSEELRQRSNERLREYYSFDEFFIEPLSRPEFTNSTVYRCAEHVGAQFGYLKYGPETIILAGALCAHLLDTINSNVYQDLLRKTDLRLAEKTS
jgi:hypothetical protein